jgi:hypothetical protein
LSGSTNPAAITMDGDKNVTATFTPSGVVHEETQTGQSSNSTTVTTSAPLAGADGHLYLAAIATRWKATVLSITGLGLNWTLVKAQCSGQNTTGIEVWQAQGIPSGNGAVTAVMANAPSNAVITVSRYSGAAATNSVGNLISGNTKGPNGACNGGVNTNAYSFHLATSSDGAVIYAAATMRGATHTPGAGYTERAEILHGGAGATASVAVEDKKIASASTVPANGAFNNSVDWAVVALEIKPQIGMSKHSLSATRELPTAFELEQNYPNPFSSEARFSFAPNSGTMIKFALPEAGRVNLHIYDLTGQLVRALINEEMPAGRYGVRWDGHRQSGHAVAAGIYFYRIAAIGNQGKVLFSKTRRMMVLK